MNPESEPGERDGPDTIATTEIHRQPVFFGIQPEIFEKPDTFTAGRFKISGDPGVERAREFVAGLFGCHGYGTFLNRRSEFIPFLGKSSDPLHESPTFLESQRGGGSVPAAAHFRTPARTPVSAPDSKVGLAGINPVPVSRGEHLKRGTAKGDAPCRIPADRKFEQEILLFAGRQG